MVTANRQPNTDLEAELLRQGSKFEFFQAIRLLELLQRFQSRSSDPDSPSLNDDWLRIHPELSLGFPAADIAAIEKDPYRKRFLITTTFLGLYGVSSPLPAFYSEDLFQDARDESTGTREFLDMLQQRPFELLIEAWKKYRLFFQDASSQDQTAFDILYALSGAAIDSSDGSEREDYRWIRYTGLLGGRPRSALGLQTMLADFLGGLSVEIIPFIPRRVRIPPEQQFQLGRNQSSLGQNTFIGQEMMDCQGKFRVRIGPLTSEQFRTLLRDGNDHIEIVELIDRYLVDPLEYDIELLLEGHETKPARLGEPQWSRLGLDMVLMTGELPGNLSVVFPPATERMAGAA